MNESVGTLGKVGWDLRPRWKSELSIEELEKSSQYLSFLHALRNVLDDLGPFEDISDPDNDEQIFLLERDGFRFYVSLQFENVWDDSRRDSATPYPLLILPIVGSLELSCEIAAPGRQISRAFWAFFAVQFVASMSAYIASHRYLPEPWHRFGMGGAVISMLAGSLGVTVASKAWVRHRVTRERILPNAEQIQMNFEKMNAILVKTIRSQVDFEIIQEYGWKLKLPTK